MGIPPLPASDPVLAPNTHAQQKRRIERRGKGRSSNFGVGRGIRASSEHIRGWAEKAWRLQGRDMLACTVECIEYGWC